VLLVSALYSVLSLLFTNAARTQLSSLSLHDALPIFTTGEAWPDIAATVMEDQPLAWVFFLVFILVSTFVVLNLFLAVVVNAMERSEEHTSELQSRENLVCRLLLEKKKR